MLQNGDSDVVGTIALSPAFDGFPDVTTPLKGLTYAPRSCRGLTSATITLQRAGTRLLRRAVIPACSRAEAGEREPLSTRGVLLARCPVAGSWGGRGWTPGKPRDLRFTTAAKRGGVRLCRGSTWDAGI